MSSTTQDKKRLYREKLLAKLQPHAALIEGSLQSILVWERPVHFGALLVGVYVSLWIAGSLWKSLSVVSLVGVATALYYFVWWFTENVKIPAVNVLGTPQRTVGKKLPLPEIVNYIVGSRFVVRDLFEQLNVIRNQNPQIVTIKVCLASLFVAYLGRWISGCTILYLLVTVILVLPGFVANLDQLVALAGPGVRPYVPKIKSALDLVLTRLYAAEETKETKTD
eukprot:TRINITY_DN2363_c0_g1_i1.p1 TRINITY_DN2363_c0_g1~~TRINITY_DN2363_c0_g1_i1.p1  ORF type:complete len:223 (-),score=62.82 TRINITY_DN2363_c0_g1_i1:137-805(-)